MGGKTFDVLDPVSNTNYATAAAGQKEDIDLAVAAAREAFVNGPWPKMKPRERARVLNRIADAVEAQEARLAELETLRHRPADHPGQGPGAARGGELPLLRGPDRGPVRRRHEGPRRPDQLRQPQADRRRRPHHPVEHPVHARVLEARPGAGHRQHRGAQAGRVHPALRLAVGADLQGRRPARRRVQPGQRPRRGSRRRPREAPGRAADLLHRRDHHRPDDLPQRRGRTSRACPWSSAASHRASCSPTPTSTPRSTPPCSASSRSTASAAPPAPGSWWSAPCTRNSATSTPPGPRTSWSATRTTPRPRSAPWSTRSTTPRWPPTWRSARPRAGCWPAAAARTTCRRATTSRRPCSPTSPRTRGSSRRRSSAPSSPSPRSTATTKPSPWRTTPGTGWRPTSGPRT